MVIQPCLARCLLREGSRVLAPQGPGMQHKVARVSDAGMQGWEFSEGQEGCSPEEQTTLHREPMGTEGMVVPDQEMLPGTSSTSVITSMGTSSLLLHAMRSHVASRQPLKKKWGIQITPFMDHSLVMAKGLVNSMPCHAGPPKVDRWVIVKSFDNTWCAGRGNGKPLQYSCHKRPMNSIKRQEDPHPPPRPGQKMPSMSLRKSGAYCY